MKDAFDKHAKLWKDISFQSGPIDLGRVPELVAALYERSVHVVYLNNPYEMSRVQDENKSNIMETIIFQRYDKSSIAIQKWINEAKEFQASLSYKQGVLLPVENLLNQVNRPFEKPVFQLESFWMPRHTFGMCELGLDVGFLNPLIELAKLGLTIYPTETTCYIMPRPLSLSLNSREQLHGDGRPAIEWTGYKRYYLNGVEVPEQVAMVPANDLNPRFLLSERNAEVKREIIRKIGIDQVCTALDAKVIDEWNGYQLLDLNLGENRFRPYLKMINPSTGSIHVEGVHPNCRSVRQSLAWREGLDSWTEPEKRT